MSSEVSKLRPGHQNRSGKFSSQLVIRSFLLTLSAALMVLPSGGCANGFRLGRLGFGDAFLEVYRDRVWAQRAFNLRYANCDIPYTNHFQNGFIAGYCDTCNGGDGYAPALPPDNYRGFEYQSSDGAQCVKAWFDGFPAGVAAARKDRAGEFHEIYTSRVINAAISQENAKHILPDDVPVLETEAAQGPVSRTSQLPPSRFETQAVSTLAPTYVAPPEKTPNPILNPNSIKESDLIRSPKIDKTGPTAMAPASSSSRFTIDPVVAKSTPTISRSIEPIAKSLLKPSRAPLDSVAATDSPTAPPALPTVIALPTPPLRTVANVPVPKLPELVDAVVKSNSDFVPPIVVATKTAPFSASANTRGLPPVPQPNSRALPPIVSASGFNPSNTPIPMATRAASLDQQNSSRRR